MIIEMNSEKATNKISSFFLLPFSRESPDCVEHTVRSYTRAGTYGYCECKTSVFAFATPDCIITNQYRNSAVISIYINLMRIIRLYSTRNGVYSKCAPRIPAGISDALYQYIIGYVPCTAILPIEFFAILSSTILLSI